MKSLTDAWSSLLPNKTLLEVVCCSVDDCLKAQDAGADRIELCSAIELGGLTPSIGLFAQARAIVSLPLFAMIRPRAGGFRYATSELNVMQQDLSNLANAGADGLVFGALDGSDCIDEESCESLIQSAQGLPCTFHRAFQSTPDPLQALRTLMQLGFSRVLASGHSATALEGATMLKTLLEEANGKIGIVAAGQIRAKNVKQVIAATGCSEIHIGPFVATEAPGYGSYKALRLDEEQVRLTKSLLGVDSQSLSAYSTM